MSNLNLENVRNKKILVIGMGRSGLAAANAMATLGNKVVIQDDKTEDSFDLQTINYLKSKEIELSLGKKPEDLSSFDMAIVSPGVDPETGLTMEAKNSGAEIVGELEIAFRIARGQFVAITGTNGKTTTTTLVGEIFRAAKRKTHVVGNIGIAVISKALESEEDDWLITETSSFQLQTIKYFNPHVSAILNITPDHLNRHHTMENYAATKGRIFENQTAEDFVVINADDEYSKELVKNAKSKVAEFSSKHSVPFGAYLEGTKLVLANGEEKTEICDRSELQIIGIHNVENALAAALICYLSDISLDVIRKTLTSFKGVEHRIEYAGEIDGVKYYNDSKGTNVDAALTAIRAIEKNIILIAGGDGKSQDFAPLLSGFNGAVKHMVLIGRDGPIIANEADKVGFKEYSYGKDMEECVKLAKELAEPGDTVLLSPACASWDMYKNYEQRGEHFKGIVDALMR